MAILISSRSRHEILTDFEGIFALSVVASFLELLLEKYQNPSTPSHTNTPLNPEDAYW